ncbi:MAG TPA: FkbM family methyltransferase [Chthonomonadales bacterium]|nr:FkbM family methyltransferase [Chthonomonadales bacterium]
MNLRRAMGSSLAKALPSRPVFLPILGGPLRGRLFCASYSLRPAYLVGTYERPVAQAIVANLRPGAVAYDVGANIGYLSLIMARQVGRKGQVYAFEPSPSSYRILETNGQLNRKLPLRGFPVAVADRSGVESFSFFQYDLVSRLGDCSRRYDDCTVIKVIVEPLDRMIATLGLRLPDFVKIDVEGAEERVLEGMRDTLLEAHPTLLLETHTDELERSTAARLQEIGYCVTVLSGKPPRHLLAVWPDSP